MSVTGFNRRRRELARREKEGQSKAGTSQGQATEKEPTFHELRHQAKEKGIEGYGKMNKQELLQKLQQLKEGE